MLSYIEVVEFSSNFLRLCYVHENFTRKLRAKVPWVMREKGIKVPLSPSLLPPSLTMGTSLFTEAHSEMEHSTPGCVMPFHRLKDRP